MPGFDESYDAVIIGAGHNGLILANYLARSGLSVAVFERRLESGGGLTTEEATIPGFLHNLHSCFHDLVDFMPAIRDLELARYHLRYICPEVQVALPFEDGPGGLAVSTDLERTCRSIARVSARDARTWREVGARYREFFEVVVLPALYTPPLPPSHQALVLEKSAEGLDYLRLSRARPLDVVEDLFEDERVRALVLFQLAIPRGVAFDFAGLGMLVPLVVSGLERSQLCEGGSHGLAHALWRALIAAGGRLRGVAEVTRIVVERGAARGVELQDGTRVEARKLVASAVDLGQTFLRLVGPEHLPAALVEKVRRFRLDDFSIFGLHLALREPPRFRAAAAEPDLDRGLKTAVGFERPQDFERTWREVRAGELPTRPALYVSAPTLFDPSQAPPGRHTLLVWQPAPHRLRAGGPDAWDGLRESFADRVVERLRDLAPNLGGDNILARRALTPLDIARKLTSMPEGGVFHGRMSQEQIDAFRPLPELSQYRTPLERLYLCGASTHPGGGITGAPAYNALQTIAEDLKLERWWA